MDSEVFVRLFEHMEWADARVRDALAAAADPPAEVVQLYAHLLAAEIVWLDRVEGRAASVSVWPDADLEQCAELARRASTARRTFVEHRLAPDADTGGALARSVRYVNSAGRTFETPLGEILLHLALHGAYHRGQIATRLRAAGAEPQPTDFIAFVRGAPAATREDARRP